MLKRWGVNSHNHSRNSKENNPHTQHTGCGVVCSLMFTGIIEELGKVSGLARKAKVLRLSVSAKKISDGTKIGDSISVNGACLTVIDIKSNTLSFDVMSETLNKTNLSKLRLGQMVNLERSLKMGDRLSGHIVLGHIDGMGRIVNKSARGKKEARLEIAAPVSLKQYLAQKGSIAVDGISLTIAEVRANRFNVYLIPHTLENTNLGRKNAGDLVNLEIDVLARYAAKSGGSS